MDKAVNPEVLDQLVKLFCSAFSDVGDVWENVYKLSDASEKARESCWTLARFIEEHPESWDYLLGSKDEEPQVGIIPRGAVSEGDVKHYRDLYWNVPQYDWMRNLEYHPSDIELPHPKLFF